MKKTLSILLALALVLSMGVLTVFAAPTTTDGKVVLTADKSSAKVGDTVTVTVTATPDSALGIGSLQFKLRYDTTALELVSFNDAGYINSAELNPAPGNLGYAATTTGSITSAGKVVTATFKVLKTEAEVNLVLEVFGLSDFDGTDVSDAAVNNSVLLVHFACDHTYGNWAVTTPATCTTPGEETRTCTACGAEDHRAISATGHHYGDWVVTTPATCTTPGVETRTCNDCGATETRPTALAAHTPGAWEVETPATCTEAGVEVQKCTECGTELDSRAISALGHHVEDWVVDTAPDCENEGHRHGECTVCHATVDEDMDALGHTVADDDWVVETPATCTEPGLKKAVCAVCGEEVEEVIAPLGHNYGEWVVTKEPTATEEGSKERVCSVCGEKEVVAIDKLTATTDTSIPNIPKTSGTVAAGIAALAMLSMAAGVASVTVKKKHEDD
ncbi:MAG: cohesin domain-containing protein [Paludibacteraceae bacterium]